MVWSLIASSSELISLCGRRLARSTEGGARLNTVYPGSETKSTREENSPISAKPARSFNGKDTTRGDS